VELNTKGRYAVTALADLAKYGAGEAVSLASVSERQQLPLSYLEQIFMSLRRSGLVESARGRSGGYRLTKPADAISVADIMHAVEEQTRMTSCRDGKTPCRGDKPCLTHSLWTALGEEIDGFLSHVTLQDVLDGIPAGKRGVFNSSTGSVPNHLKGGRALA
jgi:Rrf2 family transcriptional regulator, iron-sulfur cluster assembly transcription factor